MKMGSQSSWNVNGAQLEYEGLFSNEFLMTRATKQKFLCIVAPYLQQVEFNAIAEGLSSLNTLQLLACKCCLEVGQKTNATLLG